MAEPQATPGGRGSARRTQAQGSLPQPLPPVGFADTLPQAGGKPPRVSALSRSDGVEETRIARRGPDHPKGGGGAPTPKRRSPPGDIRLIHLRRSRYLPQDGGGTVFCVMTYLGETHGALAYLTPGQFPEFDGEEAWFRVRWVSKAKREFLEQVEGK